MFNGLVIPWGGLAGVTLFAKASNLEVAEEFKKMKVNKVYLPIYKIDVEVVKVNLAWNHYILKNIAKWFKIYNLHWDLFLYKYNIIKLNKIIFYSLI